MNNNQPSICIIAHNACGAMRGDVRGHIGGAEFQTALLARWLAGRGYPTSLLTWDEGLPRDSVIDGVRVISICRADAGIPGLRFIHPRTTGLFAAMRKADADIYYHNSAENVTGVAAAWCRLRGRSFVYSVASDVACEKDLPAMKRLRDRILYRYGLRNATRILVQTERQRELLKHSFSVDSVPVPMPCRHTSRVGLVGVCPPAEPRVAWVGRIDSMKRMELLLEIAERMPEVNFDLVGANLELALRLPHLSQYARRLKTRAQSMANVTWHGSLPPEKVMDVYRQSLCLCCTSIYEGFPNTFLEAWSQGRPVVSSFDPDGLIHSDDLGSFANTADDFAAAIRRLIAVPEMWRRQSRNCLDYYSKTHALDVAMPRFELAITSVWRKTVLTGVRNRP